MCQQEMCYWDDVWDVKTWRLGEQKPFEDYWIIEYDDCASYGPSDASIEGPDLDDEWWDEE